MNFSPHAIRLPKTYARAVREAPAAVAAAAIPIPTKADIISADLFAGADADIAFAPALCFYFLNFFETDKINVD